MAIPGLIRNRWWELPKSEIGNAVVSVAQAILNDDGYRRSQFARYGRRYGGMGIFGLSTRDSQLTLVDEDLNQTIRYSLVREVVDAALAQLTVAKPRAMPLTDGGDWSLQRKAKLLGQFINGEMFANDGDEKGILMLRDALIFGTGILKVTHDGQRIHIERVLPWEVVCDQADAMYRNPQRMYQSRLVDKATLENMFGESDAIKNASADPFNYDYLSAQYRREDVCTVFEGWSLPSKKGAKDGRHVICTTAGVLVDEKWTDTNFPFVIMTCTDPLIGLWGSGMAEEIAPYEVECNRILNANKLSMQLHGIPMVLVEEGSKFNISKLTNAPGQIYTYTGTKPEVVINKTVSQESLEALAMYRQNAFERFGLNQVQAAGQKPSGIQSGVAIRTVIDLASTRLGVIQKRYEAVIVELGRRIIDSARDLYTNYDVDMKTSAPDTKFLKQIKWSEVDLEDSEYILQVFPVNLLAKEPGARLEQVNEMMSSGLVSPEMARSLLQFPDIESSMNLENAPVEYSKMIVEAILEKGQYIGPTPFTPFAVADKTMLLALTKAECDGVPEEKLDLMRQWLDESQRLQNPPPPPQAPTPQMPAAPPADPMSEVPPEMQGGDPSLDMPLDDSGLVGGAQNV